MGKSSNFDSAVLWLTGVSISGKHLRMHVKNTSTEHCIKFHSRQRKIGGNNHLQWWISKADSEFGLNSMATVQAGGGVVMMCEFWQDLNKQWITEPRGPRKDSLHLILFPAWYSLNKVPWTRQWDQHTKIGTIADPHHDVECIRVNPRPTDHTKSGVPHTNNSPLAR